MLLLSLSRKLASLKLGWRCCLRDRRELGGVPNQFPPNACFLDAIPNGTRGFRGRLRRTHFSSFSACFLMLSHMAGKDLGEAFVDDVFCYFQFVL